MGVTVYYTFRVNTDDETCANKLKTETRGFEFFSTELNTCTVRLFCKLCGYEYMFSEHLSTHAIHNLH